MWLAIGLVGAFAALTVLGRFARALRPRGALVACAVALAAADAGLALAVGAPVLRVAVAGAIAGALASPRVYAGLATGYLRPHALAVLLALNCGAVYLAIS
jgi:hypothetical protein